MNRSSPLSLFVLFCILCATAFAGGPLVVGSPAFGGDGKPFVWDLSAGPIPYRIDGGPMSMRADGTIVISNATGITRINSMFQVWQNVNTSRIAYASAGSILPVGAFTDGDVNTPQEYDAVSGSCDSGTQNPVIFDADGSLFQQLGLGAAVIGFAGPCTVDSSGHIDSALAVLNGRFQDGIDSGDNYELTTDEFDAAFIHEFGHFSGLDHAQANLDCFTAYPCSFDSMDGLPTMFPVLMGAQQKTLGIDDVAWISFLYPETSFATSFGTIKGTIFFSDGKTPAQGVNVLARAADNSLVDVYSAVSGLYFTTAPGQTVTGTNNDGSPFGSRDAQKMGYFEIPVLPGIYTLSVEAIYPGFQGGSSVGPFDPPFSLPGTASPVTNIKVSAGNATTVNITLQGTPSTLDMFEARRSAPAARDLAAVLKLFDVMGSTGL